MTVRFSIFTLFPEMFTAPFAESILRRAIDAGKVHIDVYDLRTWTHDRHRTADDRPYGGGAGLVLMAPPIVDGVEATLAGRPARVLITNAGGRTFDQRFAEELRDEEEVVLICGHYEGIDARVNELLDAEEVSIGNYVLTGGELPAMVIVDAAFMPQLDAIGDEDDPVANGYVRLMEHNARLFANALSEARGLSLIHISEHTRPY